MVDGDRRRSRRLGKEHLVDDFAESVADQPGLEQSEYGDPDALRRAVSGLPGRQRTAIELLGCASCR